MTEILKAPGLMCRRYFRTNTLCDCDFEFNQQQPLLFTSLQNNVLTKFQIKRQVMVTLMSRKIWIRWQRHFGLSFVFFLFSICPFPLAFSGRSPAEYNETSLSQVSKMMTTMKETAGNKKSERKSV